jgi:hypothetical protein
MWSYNLKLTGKLLKYLEIKCYVCKFNIKKMCAVLESDQEGTNSYTGGRDARIMVCNLSQPRHKSLLDPPISKNNFSIVVYSYIPS